MTALTTTGTAAAADGGTPSAGQRIANALRTSPVYVDEAYADAVPPSRQRQLADRIHRTGLPIKVVLTPLTKGDAFDGDSDLLAGTVRDRLPERRDLVLITSDGDFPDSLQGYEWPGDTHQARRAVAAAGFLDEMRDAGLADLTAKAVDLVAEGKGEQRYDEAMRDLGGSARPTQSGSGSAGSGSGSGMTGWWLFIAVPALALTALATRAALLRSRRPSPAVPHVVFATARAADEARVRRRAEAEVLALGEATRAADVAATPGLQQALDAYAAAGTVLDEARGLPDLAGALALAQEGRDALAGSPGLPLCFFNPLHGRAALRTGWRPLGRRDRLDVAACQECADALRDRRAPEVLPDTDEDGRRVPYFEVPAGRSAWAASGYGSLMPPSAGLARAR
nr:NYN domain-containing protein [Streptomyces sp. SID5643]